MSIRPIPFWTRLAVVLVLAAGLALALLLPSLLPPREALYYLSPTRGPELWRVELDGSPPQQLTDTGGRVFDFTVAPDGKTVIYSIYNDLNGLDLWERRANGSSRQLFPCGADWCINPAVSPDGAQIAFSRRIANTESGGMPGVPRIWLLQRASGELDQLTYDPQITGFDPSWSPDGSRLAFFDGQAGGIRVWSLENGQEGFAHSNQGTVGDWSPDGTELLYVDTLPGEAQPLAQVYRLDLAVGKTSLAFGQDQDAPTAADYGPPDWSSQGWLAVGVQLLEGGSSRGIWIMQSDGSQARQISPQENNHYGAYRWSPDGQRLAFQQLKVTGAESVPEVAVWEMRNGQITKIAVDASRPQWGR